MESEVAEAIGGTTTKITQKASESFEPIQNFIIATFGYAVWSFTVFMTISILLLLLVEKLRKSEVVEIVLENIPHAYRCIEMCLCNKTRLLILGLSIAILLQVLFNSQFFPQTFVERIEKFNHLLTVFSIVLFVGGYYIRVYRHLSYRRRMGNPVIITTLATHILLMLTALYATFLYEIDLGAIEGLQISDGLWALGLGATLTYTVKKFRLRHLYVGRVGALLEFKGVGGEKVTAMVKRVTLNKIYFLGEDGRIISKPTNELMNEAFDVLTGRRFYVVRSSFSVAADVLAMHGEKFPDCAAHLISETIGLDEQFSRKVVCSFSSVTTATGAHQVQLSAKYPIPRTLWDSKKDSVFFRLNTLCTTV